MGSNYTKKLKFQNKKIKNNKRSAIKCLIILTFLVFSGFQPAFAANPGMDVALVLDTSGSMKKNDPNQLRVQAAKLFVSLLSRKDKVSLIGFSNRAYPVTPLLSLNTQKNESRLLKAIDKMATNGQLTNLHDAIKGGYDLLKKQKDEKRARHIILMSDGKMDLGNRSTNLKLLEKTLDELAPKLAKDKIKLHTIAFTEDSYIPLLKLAAQDTKGEFVLLKNANGIHQVFENIFERTKSPEMLPLEEDSFIVDKNVKEITIVASKFRPDTVISLEAPGGNEVSLANHNSNVKWFKARKFDLITIKKPAPGYWLIKYSEGGNKAYIVSDITLEASSTKSTADPGAPLHIQASLEKKNKRIKNKNILNSTRFTVRVTSPTGAEIENKLKDDGSEIGSERKDGIYGISYAFDKEGPYKIEITARGETFDRKKTLFVNVTSTALKTPFKIQQQVINTPDMIDTKSTTDLPVANSAHDLIDDGAVAGPDDNTVTQTVTQSKSTIDAEHETQKHHADEKPQHVIDPKKDDPLKTESQQNEHNEDADKAKKGEHSSSDEELEANESDFGIKDAVIAFITFNTFLALMGGGYYAWYRRKQRQKDKEKAADQSAQNEDNIESNAEKESEMDDVESSMELETEESLSTTISDIDLEEELSSILENENK